MNNSNLEIVPGNIVDIYWEHLEPILGATVINVASQTGECWSVLEQDGTLTMVQNFALIRKISQ